MFRPRRLRQQPQLRQMLGQVQVRKSDIIVPVFVVEGSSVKREVASMPGVFQMSIDVAIEQLERWASRGFKAFIAFGVIERSKKDEVGSVANDPNNVVCRLLKEVKKRNIAMCAMTDLCMCEYTIHGHCGPLDVQGDVANDQTVGLLIEQAVNHAKAGADVIAPSGMMDGSIMGLRTGLDAYGFNRVSLMSYAVKYASGFYGPFRDAADSAPMQGNRSSYQMDPKRDVREAVMEARLDVQQGADLLIVKPAMAYLDVIAAVRQNVDVPVVAYQVSGEYAMIQAAGKNGWIDRDRVLLESLGSMKRAGADLIVSYFADVLEGLLE
jgi:porphobilinogen synthase